MVTKRQEKARGRHADPLLRAMRRELAQARTIIRRVSARHTTSPVTR